MSQYPVDTTDGLIEAVNYLLSGPVSSGQNFEGISAVGLDAVTSAELFFTPVQTYYTGMPYFGSTAFRLREEQPGTVDYPADPLGPGPNYPVWNTLPGEFSITSITPVTATGRDITVVVTLGSLTDQSQGPWADGQVVTITGVTPSAYNKTYTVINFDPSSTSFPANTVTLRSTTSITWPAYSAGGTVNINNDFTGFKEKSFLTGNQAIVTVTGPTDRVFISSQSGTLNVYTYTKFVDILAYTPKIQFQINRYKAIAKTTLPDSPDGQYFQGYVWNLDKTIVNLEKIIGWDSIGSKVYVNNYGDIIYNNIIDSPGIGLYLYAFQIAMNEERDVSPSDGAILLVGASTTGVRSFTAQVIKR